jgi:hypothetical protein
MAVTECIINSPQFSDEECWGGACHIYCHQQWSGTDKTPNTFVIVGGSL